MTLLNIENIDNFNRVKEIAPGAVFQSVVTKVRSLDEAEEMEPWLQAIIYDTNHTAHGPAEIVDILTHKLSVNGSYGLAGFILKGKSFPTVRPKHVSHQIFRLERIKGIKTIVFAASGNVLDEVKEQLASTADRLGANLCILDSHDLARLFVAFGYLCPRDGETIRGGKCHCGYLPTTRTSNILQQDALRALQAAHELGQRAGAIIMPTGAGKTRVASIDAHRTGAQYIIYIAHSHEILMDAESEFLRTFPASEVTRFESGVRRDLSRVNLVTIQTLSRNLEPFGKRQLDYMIVDEFHHANAKSYKSSIIALKPKFLLGLTATPFRGDRKDVLENCDRNVIVNF